jgi:hypothetical protein
VNIAKAASLHLIGDYQSEARQLVVERAKGESKCGTEFKPTAATVTRAYVRTYFMTLA